MGETEKRFGIKVDKISTGVSVGACITFDKLLEEYYLFINLFKWSIAVGWLYFPKEEYE